ncbi:MAG: AAA family ATPase [Oscillospiraceae bacterium]|nr:AAA family ATPase [Oscillospiraceae bacterium]
MNIKDAKEQIKNAVTAYLTQDELGRYIIPPHKQRPVFLMGPPGIGKTAIMEQIASELGIGLLSYSMTHHTRQSALGLPLIKHATYQGKEYDVSEYTMSEIIASVYELMETSGIKNGILFLDEINCVSETLTPIMLQFLQYKVFGKHEVPAGWIVVTAGNPPEYNHSVREFDIATWDRLKRVDIEPDFDAWKEFAYVSGVHSAIMTYLEIKKNNFYKVETTVDGKSFVTARGWDDLSQMIQLYEKHKIMVDEKLIRQYLQNKQVAQDFSVYYDLYLKYKSDYQIQEILDGKASREIKARAQRAKFDERYALLGLLLDAVMNEMKQAVDTEDVLADLLKLLKEKKDVMTTKEAAVAALHELYLKVKQDYENGMTSKSLSRDHQTRLIKIMSLIQKEASLVQKSLSNDPFDVIRRDFNARVETFKQSAQKISAETANMFRFGDEVFPNGQELTILVTELTVNPYSARFISQYRVEEYFIHDKELLFHQRQIDILSEIKSLDIDE